MNDVLGKGQGMCNFPVQVANLRQPWTMKGYATLNLFPFEGFLGGKSHHPCFSLWSGTLDLSQDHQVWNPTPSILSFHILSTLILSDLLCLTSILHFSQTVCCWDSFKRAHLAAWFQSWFQLAFGRQLCLTICLLPAWFFWESTLSPHFLPSFVFKLSWLR